MRRCAAKPYEGEKAYIFVSYCHKDRSRVYPIVEQLARDGYLVWYDEGIDPGSEWPEIIARHLNTSAACIAFLSENALNSHNCRREINFALLKKKPFLSVILEQTDMSLGMEMQLSATQAIFKYTLSSEQEFFEKLYSAQLLDPCFDTPNPAITVSKPEDYQEDADGLFSEAGIMRSSFSDKWFVGAGRDSGGVRQERTGPPPEAEPPSEPEQEPEAAPEEEKEEPGPVPEEPEEEPKVVLKKAAVPEAVSADIGKEAGSIPEESEPENPEKTPEEELESAAPPPATPWLVRVKSGETIPLTAGTFKLGRSASNSYVISGNSMVGRWHAAILVRDGRCSLVDNHSMNRTFLNQQALEPEEEYLLRDGDSIRIANEKFVFYFRQTAEAEPLIDH